MTSQWRLSACLLGFAAAAAAPPAQKPAESCVLEAGDAASMLQTKQMHTVVAPQAGGPGVASKYLGKLVVDADGNPNPRISCTPGNKFARDLIVQELEALGVKPLGEAGGYLQVLANTVGKPGCEDGMANIIGVVEGTSAPDEFVVVVAHYNGPNNQGEFQEEIGNQDTNDAYDNGGSVAAALAMAKQFVASPAASSLVLMFTDGEEGFQNVGADYSVGYAICTGMQLQQDCGTVTNPNNFPIGSEAFAANPTFDMEKIRVVVGMDPVGAPGIRGSDFVAVIGAGVFEGLQERVQAAFPADGIHPIFISRQSVVDNYGDIDSFVSQGVPSVWLAQPGFQAYHGGLSTTIMPAMQAFGLADFPMYWALDRQCSLDLAALERASATIERAVRELASSEWPASQLQARSAVAFTLQDGQDAASTYAFLIGALNKGSKVTGIPSDATTAFIKVMTLFKTQVEGCLSEAPSSTETDSLVKECQPHGSDPGPVGWSTVFGMALDFYSDRLGEQGELGVEPEVVPIPCPRKRGLPKAS